jgi:hypothetical protein
MGEMRIAYKILKGDSEGKYSSVDLRVNRRIILKEILGK